MGSLFPISQVRREQPFKSQDTDQKETVSRDLLEKIQVPEPKTELEISAEQIIGPNRLTMLFANPNSELFLAMLARAVVFLFSGRSNPQNRSVDAPKDFDPAKCSVETLLAIREERV